MKRKEKIIIENLLNKKIIDSKLLSDSFGINCIKITTSDDEKYVVKYYINKNKEFNAIKSELDNLIFLNKIKNNVFPKVCLVNSNYLVMSYIENDKKKPKKTEGDLIEAIISIHQNSSDTFGFDFDTQIGGLKQKNNRNKNWVEFYRELRLGYIYELINLSDPMEKSINKKIEFLINNLENFIPNNPKISLLHGDLWEGNILFKNNKFSGFIDPGSFYGHNEMEIAYLRWFNPSFIDRYFLEKYNDQIILDKNYFNYELIYQLYYCLMNVYLWDKSYISDTNDLLKKMKI
tara:strand:- start:421 stop:1290 length:870 start_codon:yes stop_codon:yes gene_type:complete